MKYLLSFECKIKHTHTSYPRWWQFWKNPLVSYSNVWTRKVFPITYGEHLSLTYPVERAHLLAQVLARGTAATPEIRNIQVEEVIANESNGCVTPNKEVRK